MALCWCSGPKELHSSGSKDQDLISATILIIQFIACFHVKHHCWEACQKPQFFSHKSSQCVSSQLCEHPHHSFSSKSISLSSPEKAPADQTICCSATAPSPKKAPAVSQSVSEGMSISQKTVWAPTINDLNTEQIWWQSVTEHNKTCSTSQLRALSFVSFIY